MGVFTVPIRVGDLDWNDSVELEAMVDTGSAYTLIPAGILTRLGVKPEAHRRFELADNRIVAYAVGYARLRVNDDETITIVVFAQDDSSPLLGAATLEHLSLGVDPVNQRLIPVTTPLKQAVRRKNGRVIWEPLKLTSK